MLGVLRHRTYRHLFLAQVIALVGTGLATVALGLLAYQLAGADAGAVLGTALAVKMIAYVGVAPVAAAFAERVPRRAMLVALDVVRASVAAFLPFVTEIWQVYVLIFILQSASAAFTPTFQATIPDLLPDEKRYWAFMPPLALLLGATVLRTWAGSAVAALVAGFAVYDGAAWLADFRWRETPEAYARVAEMLPPGTVVYSANPWEFAFHTRLPAVMTPYSDDLEVLRATAQRYGVEYLVTIGEDSRYPAFEERPPGEWPDIYEPVFDDGQLGIWRIVGE